MKRISKSLREFCDKEELLRLAYLDSDGYPRVIPLWFAKVGTQYCAGTHAASPKWNAVKRNKRVGWVIDGGKRDSYKGMSMRGTAVEINDIRKRAAVHRALSVKYFGGPNDPSFLELYGEPDDQHTAYFMLVPEGGFCWEY